MRYQAINTLPGSGNFQQDEKENYVYTAGVTGLTHGVVSAPNLEYHLISNIFVLH
jgi:hypothetical protein